MNAVLHGAHDDGFAVQFAARVDDGVVQARFRVFARFRRSAYGLRSVNFSGSVETRLPSSVSYWPSSSSWPSRVRASMRKCRSHLGQTLRFWSRSFFQMIWRHWSHLTQRPSVLTRFSPEVSSCSLLALKPCHRNDSFSVAERERIVAYVAAQYSMPRCASMPLV